MLAKVVLAVEGAFLLGLLLAGKEVMGFEVFRGGVEQVAEDTVSASCGWHGEGGGIVGTASPAFESKVQGLLVSLPVILGRKGVRAEGTLEYASRARFCLLSCDSLCHRGAAAATALGRATRSL